MPRLTASDRRKRLRAHLYGSRCVQPATVFDALSARIADILGFEFGMLPGSVASAMTLAAPDLTLITLTELVGHARQITRTSNISLIVDADHGYGNALNVARTVEELESAGASALSIEDTLLPTPFRPSPAEAMAREGRPQHSAKFISTDEMVGKLRAALEARIDPSLVVAGRTGSLSTEGVEGAVERVRAYTDAGVDAIFLTGVKTRQELEAIHAATPLPLLIGGPPPALADLDVLASLGVRIALKGHVVLPMVVQAMYDALKSQKEGRPSDTLRDRTASAQLMEQVLSQEKYARWQKDFLGSDEG